MTTDRLLDISCQAKCDGVEQVPVVVLSVEEYEELRNEQAWLWLWEPPVELRFPGRSKKWIGVAKALTGDPIQERTDRQLARLRCEHGRNTVGAFAGVVVKVQGEGEKAQGGRATKV